MILILLRDLGSLVLLERALRKTLNIWLETTHCDDDVGLLYMPTKIFEGSTPDGPCILGKRFPILANVLCQLNTVPSRSMCAILY